MKNLTLSLLFIFLVSLVFARKDNAKDIPSAVKSKFDTLYPQVKDVKWTSEESNFEGEFKVDGIEMSVLLDSNGNLLETEQEIAVSLLPPASAEYLAKEYPGKKITEAAKITDANGKITYEAEVVRKDVMFDKDGNLIGESEK